MKDGNDLSVEDKIKMKDKIKVSNLGKLSLENEVKRENIGEVIGDSYNTLWSIVFTLDPIKKVNNEVWMIQDEEAPRRSTKYLAQLMERRNRFIKKPAFYESLPTTNWTLATVRKSSDYVGFIGGLLFILSALSQFIVSKINSRKDKDVEETTTIQMQQMNA